MFMCRMRTVIVLLELIRLKEIKQIMRGCSRGEIEADSLNFVLNAMCYW